jgi:hypothetical protein
MFKNNKNLMNKLCIEKTNNSIEKTKQSKYAKN